MKIELGLKISILTRLNFQIKKWLRRRASCQCIGPFNFWICNPGTRFCPVPSWHHLLFGIRFYCCVLFIKHWFLESRFPSVLVPTYHLLFHFIVFSMCIVVFIGNLRARTCDYASSVRYVSQQRRRTPFPPLKISISIVVNKDSEG